MPQQPIVIAYHLIFTAYGWWLPNDPRGSMSHTIESDVIADLGKLHYGRKRIQPSSRDIRSFYSQAQKVLKFPLLEFGMSEMQTIADSFSRVVQDERYTCYACALMTDHVHLLIRKHKHNSEKMIECFQDASRNDLSVSKLRQFGHPVWGGPGWTVFLDHPDDIRRTIRYIEDNPVKLKRPKQVWPFVIEYDGWPLHSGHDPRSPYARRMRK